MQGMELDWFSSYLNGRKQVTQIGENYSFSTVVTSGVAQGSVLGPLLFTLYINDFANILPIDSKIYFYADDTAIFTRAKSIGLINRALNADMIEVSKWLQTNFFNS